MTPCRRATAPQAPARRPSALDEYTAGAQIDESELELAVPWALFTAPAPNATISIGEIALGDTRASGLDAASAVMLADQLARSRRLAQVRRLA